MLLWSVVPGTRASGYPGNIPGDGPTTDPLDNFLSLVDAARLLRINPDSLRKKAVRGEIPGARKWQKRWIFERETLREFKKTYRATRGRPPRRT